MSTHYSLIAYLLYSDDIITDPGHSVSSKEHDDCRMEAKDEQVISS